MRRAVLLLVFVAIVLVVVYGLVPKSPRIPESAVLVLELGGELEESPPMDPLGRLLAEGPALPTVLLQIEKAGADDRVQGVLLHIRPMSIGYARIQEIRDAIARLKRQGKQVAALLDLSSLNATREVYLASAASQVYVVPGFVGPLAGIAGEFLFLGELMEKLGVQIEYERAGTYKSAPETLAEREMSAEAREMMNQVLDTLFRQVVVGIGIGRGMSADQVTALIDEAPAIPSAYLTAKLADGIASRREVIEILGGEDAEEVDFETYLNVDPRELGLRTGPTVALIFGDGTIVQSRGRSFRGNYFAADRVIEALREAAGDSEIRAIVLRVNSGGGSALASEAIWRVIREVRETKPVVVSLADAAASGGYYVASAADAVIAEPATITGSIGVFLLRPNLGELYAKLGVHSEVMTRGRLASLPSSSAPLTPDQREITRTLVNSLYTQFLERVGEGRGMTPEEVDALAQGRVWLGETAHTLGLVDEVGGMRAAVERAKREAGVDDDLDPLRMIYPGPRSLRDQVRDLFRGEIRLGGLLGLDHLRIPDPLLGWAALLSGEPAYLPTAWLELE